MDSKTACEVAYQNGLQRGREEAAIKWHKVSEGDLPKPYVPVLGATLFPSGVATVRECVYTGTCFSFAGLEYPLDISLIDMWAEMPTPENNKED